MYYMEHINGKRSRAMVKVFFQDKNGNAPMVAAFVPFREARAILRQALAEISAKGVSATCDGQRIIAANGAKYWLG
jgi:hypothetical protein